MTRLGSLSQKKSDLSFLEPEPMEALFPKTTYIEPVPTEMVRSPDFGKFFFHEIFVLSFLRVDYFNHLTVSRFGREILTNNSAKCASNGHVTALPPVNVNVCLHFLNFLQTQLTAKCDKKS